MADEKKKKTAKKKPAAGARNANKKNPFGLSDIRKRFVEEFMYDMNGTQAAIRAGYSTRSAMVTASRLLSDDNVRAYLETLQAERSRRLGISGDRVVQELAKLAYYNAQDIVNMETGELKEGASRYDSAAISSVKVKYVPVRTEDGDFVQAIEREVRFADKNKALDLLGKHLGLYKEKIEIDIEGTGVVLLPPVEQSEEYIEGTIVETLELADGGDSDA